MILGVLLGAFLVAGVATADERVVSIFEGRQISVSVPSGWRFEESRDAKTGVQTVEIGEPKSDVQLDVSFIPDSQGRLATREGLEAEMRRVFAPYLSGSVEREMKFANLDVPAGIGAYTFFTDRSLVGKKIPAGERLISTTGIHAWKGAYLIFTLLSNSRDTDSYRQALEIVRTSFRETRGSKEAQAPAAGPIGFTVPRAPWVLTVPGEGMTVREQKVKPDGTSGYFYMTGGSTGLNVSFFIEPASKCSSSRDCRDMVQKAGFAHIGKVENIVASQIGDVSVVECFLPEFKGIALRQQHLFAEFVLQGYWVDMHVSKAGFAPTDRQQFESLVSAISFAPKEDHK